MSSMWLNMHALVCIYFYYALYCVTACNCTMSLIVEPYGAYFTGLYFCELGVLFLCDSAHPRANQASSETTPLARA